MIKKHFLYAVLASAVLFSSCATKKQTTTDPEEYHSQLIMSVAWFQNAPEVAALYHQGFNIARERVDEILENNKFEKPLAVVTDIDETIINNSPFEASLIAKEENQAGWYAWTAQATAAALPGALEFAKYLESKNIAIFYITNRDDNEREGTLKNLKMLGFPLPGENHLLTKSDLSYTTGNTSSKKERREKVSETHEIVLLLGDNLNDFSELFEDRKENNGKAAVEANKALFGQKFIVFPNPMYGAFEKPLYNYEEGLTDAQKRERLKTKLKAE